MREKGIIRAAKCPWSRNDSFLRLFRVDQSGYETLVATSSPVTKVAAAAVCRLFEGELSPKVDMPGLKRVLQIPGRTAWASFTAYEPSQAALKACLEHDLTRAKGVVIITTLSMNSNIVSDLRSVLNVVHPHVAALESSAYITAYDESLNDHVRVEILLMGL